jgi:hypothetical protein
MNLRIIYCCYIVSPPCDTTEDILKFFVVMHTDLHCRRDLFYSWYLKLSILGNLYVHVNNKTNLYSSNREQLVR